MAVLKKWARVALAGAALLMVTGCVYAPPPPAYAAPGYYGYAPGYAYGPYYYGPPVSLSFGYWSGWHHRWH